MEWSLKPWEMSDAPVIALYANDPAVAANLRDVFPYPYTRKDAETFIGACMAGEQVRQLCRAICVDGRAAGSIGVFRQEDIYCRQAEIGYWLARPYWGKGIMSAAVRRMCEEAFVHWNIMRISAEVFASNTGSQRVLEKNGFQREGILRQSVYKNGKLMDSYLYALLREDEGKFSPCNGDKRKGG